MPHQGKLKVAVIASGRGSNFQALIDASEKGEMSAEIVLLLSDKENSKALERAKKHGIKTAVLNKNDYPSRQDFDRALAKKVSESGAELVCLAGFMRILTSDFLENANCPVINIHPALLPSFPGLNAQKQALHHGVKITGVTVHFVDEGVDTGSIILQTTVEVKENDTVDSLSERILKQEHIIYPKAVQRIADGLVLHPDMDLS